jgi:hypothetical protein
LVSAKFFIILSPITNSSSFGGAIATLIALGERPGVTANTLAGEIATPRAAAAAQKLSDRQPSGQCFLRTKNI